MSSEYKQRLLTVKYDNFPLFFNLGCTEHASQCFLLSHSLTNFINFPSSIVNYILLIIYVYSTSIIIPFYFQLHIHLMPFSHHELPVGS